MTHNKYAFLLSVLMVAIGFSPSLSAEWKSKGEMNIESRAFSDDDKAQTQDANLALTNRIYLSHDSGNRYTKLRLFSRVDSSDESRSLFFIEEAFTEWDLYPFSLKVGAQILNWTALEAFHPADIFNSRNFDSNFENAEKMGEWMVEAKYLFQTGSLAAYLMPEFTAPEFPNPSVRLSLSNGSELGRYRLLNRDGDLTNREGVLQGALRLDKTFGNTDMSVHLVSHQDRSQPVFVSDSGTLRPIYLPVTQVGGTLSSIWGENTLKAEWAYRDFQSANTSLGYISQPDHWEIATGIERTFAHLSGKESTFLLEYQRYLLGKSAREALGLFQNDILFGHRFVFNDIPGREIFTSLIWDLDGRNEYLISTQYKQRLSDTWTLATGIRLMDSGKKDYSGLSSLKEADNAFLNLTRYF